MNDPDERNDGERVTKDSANAVLVQRNDGCSGDRKSSGREVDGESKDSCSDSGEDVDGEIGDARKEKKRKMGYMNMERKAKRKNAMKSRKTR
jgi:hypothetical protein